MSEQVLPGVTGTQNKALSAWFTPTETARRIVRFACIPNGARVLEPSCGRGALIAPMAAESVGCHVVGIDIDRANVEYCASRDWGLASQEFLCGNFLRAEPHPGEFNVVCMNPPFESGQTEAHILRALEWSLRVVCHCPLTTLAGKVRGKRLWANVELTRLAICSTRPKYSERAGMTDMCAIEVVKRSGVSDRRVETMVEWWP